MCGWTDQSSNAAVYSWQRRQREGSALPDSGPTSDYSTGTAAGGLSYWAIFVFSLSVLLLSSVFESSRAPI